MQFKIYNLLLIILFCFLLFFPFSTKAVVLYLEPSEANFYQGDTFIIEARIDTEGECINTIEAEIVFANNILEVRDFSQGNSLLSLWIKEPEFSNQTGLVSFSGGIPGGYCGRLTGDIGISNLLGRIIFRVSQTSLIDKPLSTKVRFSENSQVLLHDSLGTPASLITKGAVFTVLSGIPEFPREEWQEELKKDTISPEPFVITLEQDLTVFEGKYFITFSTTDKQTGIAYYEVQEGEREWQRVSSPYVLENQRANDTIKVKAVDKTGNEFIAEYIPTKNPLPVSYWIIILIVLIGIGLIWLKIKKKPKNSVHYEPAQRNYYEKSER